MERLLLLWDELDELMCYGRHMAVGLSRAIFPKGLRKPPALEPLN